MMNLRLARPSALVDIGGIPDLAGTTTTGSCVDVGSLTRHVALERTSQPGALGHLLRRAAKHIGHLPIRVRGTIGGSIAHADPAAEWCVVARALNATFVAHGPAGERFISAADFFQGFFTTALAADEILTAVQLPHLGPQHAVGFAEFARRAGDFAIVAVVCDLSLEDGRIADARVGLGGVADIPLRAEDAEDCLVGEVPSQSLFRAAAERASRHLRPPSDIQASPEDRLELVRALVGRALHQADRARAARPAEVGVP
jgi:carbon-monoxide dehydrogenase medium subunit